MAYVDDIVFFNKLFRETVANLGVLGDIEVL
jgi:hypothetical protein